MRWPAEPGCGSQGPATPERANKLRFLLVGKTDSGNHPSGWLVARTVRYSTADAEIGPCKGLISHDCKLLLLLCGYVERNPGPLRFVQQNVNGVSAVKLSSLLALDADVYLLPEVKKLREASRICKVPPYTVYCSPPNARGGRVAILVHQRSSIQTRSVTWKALPNDAGIKAVTVKL
ncbi:T. brucei spp.-specific protein [Trypanosoma brucei gambiense DAL972]|uniref:T. brucei spp.-specific protein n=1 Tax=Trypanosoma brucei gambiense (strain MHOM/CI/86/DAL972) TaxID=679716 RepID=C9ZIG8_TRYB9|nr:T. brucei spp.-specific protein [Trypanosoma brucei gambiense DAL972]CBH08960.1 T. brucei spp.-specific protein [Trypanosoma brucei gambiense DAL972]|eukprot:XP_011771401.1 T. brucei spp.-specific protein [Trypanosoma brucei gambiense DAL972]